MSERNIKNTEEEDEEASRIDSTATATGTKKRKIRKRKKSKSASDDHADFEDEAETTMESSVESVEASAEATVEESVEASVKIKLGTAEIETTTAEIVEEANASDVDKSTLESISAEETKGHENDKEHGSILSDVLSDLPTEGIVLENDIDEPAESVESLVNDSIGDNENEIKEKVGQTIELAGDLGGEKGDDGTQNAVEEDDVDASEKIAAIFEEGKTLPSNSELDMRQGKDHVDAKELSEGESTVEVREEILSTGDFDEAVKAEDEVDASSVSIEDIDNVGEGDGRQQDLLTTMENVIDAVITDSLGPGVGPGEQNIEGMIASTIVSENTEINGPEGSEQDIILVTAKSDLVADTGADLLGPAADSDGDIAKLSTKSSTLKPLDEPDVTDTDISTAAELTLEANDETAAGKEETVNDKVTAQDKLIEETTYSIDSIQTHSNVDESGSLDKVEDGEFLGECAFDEVDESTAITNESSEAIGLAGATSANDFSTLNDVESQGTSYDDVSSVLADTVGTDEMKRDAGDEMPDNEDTKEDSDTEVEPKVKDTKPTSDRMKTSSADEDIIQTHEDSEVGNMDDECLTLSIVTWNLGEAAPSERKASFFRKFRKSKLTDSSSKQNVDLGSDLVMIGAQECEDIKPRRSEGHRSRHLRRMGIQMLGEDYVPLAIHSLGGIQMALYCHRDVLGDVEMINIADVTCGVGNVFYNKGAIGVYLKMKHRDSAENGVTKSSRMLFVTAHLAAHVKHVDARNDDFKRIMSELESQAPIRFLRPRRNADGSPAPCDGSNLLSSMDHIYFSGDLSE